MKIVVLGLGPDATWVQRCLVDLGTSVEAATKPDIELFEGVPSREALNSCFQNPIDGLILSAHAPCAASPQASEPLSMDSVRSEAQRAISALELAQHSRRTVVLRRGQPIHWAITLAEIIKSPPPIRLVNIPEHPDESGVFPAFIAEHYLKPLFDAAMTRELPRVIWSRELFLNGDQPGEQLPATIEVAGRARILAYGPYLPLPLGEWHARIFLGFSPDLGKMPFILEVDSSGSIARGFFEVERGGIFSVELDFTVADSSYPLELRLISQDSALEGQVALIEVELTPQNSRFEQAASL